MSFWQVSATYQAVKYLIFKTRKCPIFNIQQTTFYNEKPVDD